MKYLLDTNVCVRYLNGESEILNRRLQAKNLEDIVVCSIVKMELFYGAMRSNNPDASWRKHKKFLEVFISLPFDDIAAFIAGRVWFQLTSLGTPIGANDLLIASITLAHDLTLVTHNISEFCRVEGLRIEDWEIEP
jgi:tRNA(fMet)-specific endonuclease VapC